MNREIMIAARYREIINRNPGAPQKANRTASLLAVAAEFDVSPRTAHVLIELGGAIIDARSGLRTARAA